jgi:hypothetical protein
MTKKEIDTKLEIAEILVKHLNCETSEALTPIYEYLEKQLLIQRVSQQRELLIAYHKYNTIIKNDELDKTIERHVDQYLSNL